MHQISKSIQWSYIILVALFHKLGFSGVNIIAKIVGALSWYCLPSRRKIALNAISRHLDMPLPVAKSLARESFTENFKSFFECMLIPSVGLKHPKITIVRPDLMNILMHYPRPIVTTSAHLGSWELLAGILGEISDIKSKLVVVRDYRNIFMKELTTALRSSRGATVIGHRKATFSVLRSLRKNGIVAFLVDHNTSKTEAIFLPFLGEIAAVNMGPAVLAIRTKALVMPGFLLREGDDYMFWLEDPLDTALLEGTIETKIETVARYYTEAVEKAIQRVPSQWFWMHNRWKTRPVNS